MPFDGPAAGIGGAMLSRLDLTDPENAKDAVFEIKRCVTDADYARWARRWARPVEDLLTTMEDRTDWISPEDATHEREDAYARGRTEALAEVSEQTGLALKAVRTAAERLAGMDDELRAAETALEKLK
jgi:hypothetical protein